jgi:hypothetical protein
MLLCRLVRATASAFPYCVPRTVRPAPAVFGTTRFINIGDGRQLLKDLTVRCNAW